MQLCVAVLYIPSWHKENRARLESYSRIDETREVAVKKKRKKIGAGIGIKEVSTKKQNRIKIA